MQYINPIIIKLLEQRGVSGDTDIREFLSAKPQRTYDPYLLPDLKAGADLVLKTISDGKTICIYGDYDADGITSVSILMEFLGALTHRIGYYIPSRFDEGYGLNKEAVKKIRQGGADLLITVDCGSVSYEEVELAKSLGMEVLVTDHHSITDVRADCLLINPKRSDSQYPFQELAGCGVAFKLAQGIQKKAGLARADLNRTLDLVALGTIADVVPLLDENRTLVKHGMNIISSGLRPGLRALIEGIALKRDCLRSDQIAFGVAPHLNAAGRMGDARIAACLMLELNSEAVPGQVQKLIAFNHQRKETQEEALRLCINIIEESLTERNFLVVHAKNIHEGIAGIVAGKLKDKYGRPTILVTSSGEYLKGTGRSVPGVNLYETLKAHEALFERYGGHEGACGFLMKPQNLEALAQALEESMVQLLSADPELLSRRLSADMTLSGSEVTLDFARDLEMLAPFGSKNRKPLFLLEQATITKRQVMGRDGTHIRFTAICRDGSQVECVLFNRAKDFLELLSADQPVDLTGSVDFQEWNGKQRVQFNVELVV